MSKKKKTPQQKKAQPRPKTPSEVRSEFQQEVEANHGSALNLSDAPDEMKMSAKLIDMVEPYMEDDIPPSVLFDCAAIEWNECLKEDWNASKTSCVLDNMLMDFRHYRGLIDTLKERKRQLFMHDTRAIQRVKVYETDDGRLNINVVSDWDAMTALRATMERLTEDS